MNTKTKLEIRIIFRFPEVKWSRFFVGRHFRRCLQHVMRYLTDREIRTADHILVLDGIPGWSECAADTAFVVGHLLVVASAVLSGVLIT